MRQGKENIPRQVNDTMIREDKWLCCLEATTYGKRLRRVIILGVHGDISCLLYKGRPVILRLMSLRRRFITVGARYGHLSCVGGGPARQRLEQLFVQLIQVGLQV
jgi:hypothetical protein